MHLPISELNPLISPQLLVSYDFPLKYSNETVNIRGRVSNNYRKLPGKVFKATQKSLQIFAAEQIPQRNCILE